MEEIDFEAFLEILDDTMPPPEDVKISLVDGTRTIASVIRVQYRVKADQDLQVIRLHEHPAVCDSVIYRTFKTSSTTLFVVRYSA